MDPAGGPKRHKNIKNDMDIFEKHRHNYLKCVPKMYVTFTHNIKVKYFLLFVLIIVVYYTID